LASVEDIFDETISPSDLLSAGLYAYQL